MRCGAHRLSSVLRIVNLEQSPDGAKDMPGERAISESKSTPMSFITFQFEIKRRWKILKEEETALANAYTLFAEKKEIWPDQCKSVLTLLYRIENPVRKLRALLENPTNLPASVVQHRHLLLMAIQHTDEQIRELIALITEFRMLCQIPSKQTANLRLVIEHAMNVLVQEYDDVVNNITLLLDQARFQERKPAEFQKVELSQEAYFCEQQGNVYNEQGKKEWAQEYLEEALRLVRKLGDHRRVLNDLRRIYNSVSEKQGEALDYLEEALGVVKEVGDPRLEEQSLNNLGVVCNDLEWLEEARAHLEEALALMKEIADQRQEGKIQRFKFV